METIEWAILLIGIGVGLLVATIGWLIFWLLQTEPHGRRVVVPEPMPPWAGEDEQYEQVPVLDDPLDTCVAIAIAETMMGASVQRIRVIRSLVAAARELEEELARQGEQQGEQGDTLARITQVLKGASGHEDRDAAGKDGG